MAEVPQYCESQVVTERAANDLNYGPGGSPGTEYMKKKRLRYAKIHRVHNMHKLKVQTPLFHGNSELRATANSF